MIFALMLNPYTVGFICLGVIFGALGIATNQVIFLFEHHQMNFIPGEIGLEADIAIVIAAFGIFLDNRRWLVRRHWGDDVPPHEQDFSDLAQRTGVGLILTAIFIEVLDLGFLSLNSWGYDSTLVKYVEISVLFLVNGIAIAAIFYFLAAVWRHIRLSAEK